MWTSRTEENTIEESMKKTHAVVLRDVIERRIYLLRGEKVMLSTDLAQLYQVAPRALVQSVKRNTERFPADFMFQLTSEEFKNLKSQIVTSSWGGLRRATPYAFTEQGRNPGQQLKSRFSEFVGRVCDPTLIWGLKPQCGCGRQNILYTPFNDVVLCHS